MSDESALEAIERRRAERKEAQRAQYEEQRVTDLEALEVLECEHGDSNIAHLDVPFTAGLPTIVAARCPSPAEVKRYRSRIKPRGDKPGGDPVDAAEEIAAVCLAYPDADTYERVKAARPGVHVQLGLLALGLVTGKAAAEGKG